jgi:hypothetical protein
VTRLCDGCKDAHYEGTPKGAVGLQASHTQKLKIKKPDFVDIMILNVLRDFPFNRNQPLKLADD